MVALRLNLWGGKIRTAPAGPRARNRGRGKGLQRAADFSQQHGATP